MFGFGSSKPTPTAQQIVRQEQRKLGSSKREIERDIASLRRTEQELMTQIKKEAQKGNTTIMRMKAKDLVKIRQQIEKLTSMTGTLTSVSTQTSVAATNVTITHAMGTAAKALSTASGSVSVEDLQKSIYTIQQQQEAFEVTDEMLDDMFTGVSDEDEADSILAQVADEIGLELTSKMGAIPSSSVPTAVATPTPTASTPSNAEIDAMIAKLLAS